MATTYYDRLNYAFEKFEKLKLPSSAQLLYLHILHIDNCLGRTGQVRCSDSTITVKTGLSPNTVTTAKRTLKNYGLLDFKTAKKNPRAGTLYFLPPNITPNTEVKTEVIAEVKGEVIAGVISSNNTTPLPFEEREKERTTANSAHASKKQLSTNSAEVSQAWFDCEVSEVKGGVALGLIELEKEHGAQALIAAIHEAHRANTRFNLSFNFVKAVLERMKKGEETNAGKPYGSRMDAWDARQDELPPE